MRVLGWRKLIKKTAERKREKSIKNLQPKSGWAQGWGGKLGFPFV